MTEHDATTMGKLLKCLHTGRHCEPPGTANNVQLNVDLAPGDEKMASWDDTHGGRV